MANLVSMAIPVDWVHGGGQAEASIFISSHWNSLIRKGREDRWSQYIKNKFDLSPFVLDNCCFAAEAEARHVTSPF